MHQPDALSLLQAVIEIVAAHDHRDASVTVLADDKNSFPPYHAAFVVRNPALTREPRLEAALQELSGRFSDDTMRRLNKEVLAQHGNVEQVAKDFLRTNGLLKE